MGLGVLGLSKKKLAPPLPHHETLHSHRAPIFWLSHIKAEFANFFQPNLGTDRSQSCLQNCWHVDLQYAS